MVSKGQYNEKVIKLQEYLYRHRSVITRWVFFLFVFIIFSNPIFEHPQAYAIAIVAGVMLSGILIITHFRMGYTKPQWNLFNLAMLVIISLSYLLNGVVFGKQAYLAIGISYLLVIPLVHFVFSQEPDQSQIYQDMSHGVVYSFYFFMAYNLLSAAALRSGQYESFLNNANSLGSYTVIVIIALLYLLYFELQKQTKMKFVYLLLLGAAFSFLFFSGSRTGILAGALILVSFWLFYFLNLKKIQWVKLAGKFMASILVSFFLLPTVLNPATLNFLGLPLQLGLDSTPTAESNEPEDGMFDDSILQRIEVLHDRLDKTIGTDMAWFDRLNRITSNRLEIWVNYLPYLQVWGHDDEYRELVLHEKYYARTNAHNVYIQMGYSAGIPAGVAMVLLMISLLWQSSKEFVRTIWIRQNNPEAVFRFATVGSFFLTSLLAASFLVFTYPVALLFWFCTFPYFFRSSKPS